MDPFLIDSPVKATFVALGIGALFLIAVLVTAHRHQLAYVGREVGPKLAGLVIVAPYLAWAVTLLACDAIKRRWRRSE